MGYTLITGASGFVGKRLIKYLAQSYELDNKKLLLLTSRPVDGFACLYHKNYSFSKGDFLLNGFTNIEAVIHMGAFIPKSSAEMNEYSGNLSNVINTSHLLNNLPSVPRKFIFISTIDVYQQTTAFIDETTFAAPDSFYGKCKLFCEDIVLQWCKEKMIIPQILRAGAYLWGW